ncbi:hypothetical protein ACIBCA_28970 [Kitasatospora sp. NPDC051170]|uniref:hypothetical protein n=1 Tax=Kitasatospora sp. NPDC051170 TaxID=3364056 RepID=UPI00379F03EB
MSEPYEPSKHTEHTSRPLPPRQGLLAVDAKDSTKLPAAQQAALSRAIAETLERALDLAGLGSMPRPFTTSTGDGLSFGFPPEFLPFVLHPFIDRFNDVLLAHNARGAGPNVRLRLSVHAGSVPLTGGRPGDGNATPRSELHRLLDSRPARDYLALGSPNATPLVAIVSDPLYRDVVVGGYCGLPRERFTEVHAEVDGKDFAQRAWMYVPSPSGGLLPPPPGTDPAPGAPKPSAPTPRPGPGGPGAPGRPRRVPTPRSIRAQRVQNGVNAMDSIIHTVETHLTTGSETPGAR